MFDVFPLFAAALRPVFVNCVYPRGQISIRLFYVQSNVINTLPIINVIYTATNFDLYFGRGIEIRDNGLCL